MHLKKVVLYMKRNEVYETGLEKLETVPLAEVQKLHAVNTYEGISIEHVLHGTFACVCMLQVHCERLEPAMNAIWG